MAEIRIPEIVIKTTDPAPPNPAPQMPGREYGPDDLLLAAGSSGRIHGPAVLTTWQSGTYVLVHEVTKANVSLILDKPIPGDRLYVPKGYVLECSKDAHYLSGYKVT